MLNNVLRRIKKKLRSNFTSPLKADLRPIIDKLNAMEARQKTTIGFNDIFAGFQENGLDWRFVLTDLSAVNRELTLQIGAFELRRHPRLLLKFLSLDDGSTTSAERDTPNATKFLANGHSRIMLSRYFFMGAVLCKDRRVLDLCSGMGWGSAILAEYAHEVLGVDLEEQAVETSKELWESDSLRFQTQNALTFVNEGEKFDVVTGAEIIEHFTHEDGRILIKRIYENLKEGGSFVGTSAFPKTRHQADHHSGLKNPAHLFIWTESEIVEELERYFDVAFVIDGWMVIAMNSKSAPVSV